MTPVAKRIATFAALAVVAVLVSVLVLWGNGTSEPQALAASSSNEAGGQTPGLRTLQWSDLLPDDTVAFRPVDSASDFPDITSSPSMSTEGRDLTGPKAGTAASKPRDHNSPRPDLAGERVAIAGYMTPLMVEDNRTRTFLLVPYVGACVHVPAPPPNQIVLVEATEPIDVRAMWEPFQAVGKLQVETVDTGLAEVGYVMELESIQPYQASNEKLEGARSAGDGDG